MKWIDFFRYFKTPTNKPILSVYLDNPRV